MIGIRYSAIRLFGVPLAGQRFSIVARKCYRQCVPVVCGKYAAVSKETYYMAKEAY